AWIGAHHRKRGPDGVDERKNTAENDEPQSRHGKPRLMDAAGVETGPEGERPRETRVQPKRRGHCQKCPRGATAVSGLRTLHSGWLRRRSSGGKPSILTPPVL